MRENSVPAHVIRELGGSRRRAAHRAARPDMPTDRYQPATQATARVAPSSLGVRLAQDYTESGYIFTLLDALHEVAVQQ